MHSDHSNSSGRRRSKATARTYGFYTHSFDYRMTSTVRIVLCERQHNVSPAPRKRQLCRHSIKMTPSEVSSHCYQMKIELSLINEREVTELFREGREQSVVDRRDDQVVSAVGTPPADLDRSHRCLSSGLFQVRFPEPATSKRFLRFSSRSRLGRLRHGLRISGVQTSATRTSEFLAEGQGREDAKNAGYSDTKTPSK